MFDFRFMVRIGYVVSQNLVRNDRIHSNSREKNRAMNFAGFRFIFYRDIWHRLNFLLETLAWEIYVSFNRRFSGIRSARARAHTYTALIIRDARVSRLLSSFVSRPIRCCVSNVSRWKVARDWRRRVARAKGRARWRARCMTGEPWVGRAKKQVWFTKWRSTSRVRDHIAHDTREFFIMSVPATTNTAWYYEYVYAWQWNDWGSDRFRATRVDNYIGGSSLRRVDGTMQVSANLRTPPESGCDFAPMYADFRDNFYGKWPRMHSTWFYACTRVARRGHGVVWNRGKSRSHMRFRVSTNDKNLAKTRKNPRCPPSKDFCV